MNGEECYYCGRTKEGGVWVNCIADGLFCCEECGDRERPCRHCHRAPCGCDDIYDQWRDRQFDTDEYEDDYDIDHFYEETPDADDGY